MSEVSPNYEPRSAEGTAVVESVSSGRDELGADEVEKVRAAFVQLWGSLGSFWGVSPTTARVHSWLLSKAEPVDTDDIMEGLSMSRGAVSMACRELREWGLIRPEKAAGERRIRYRPATDLEKVIRSIVRVRKRREWDPVLEGLREWIPRLEAAHVPEAKVFEGRLRSLESLLGVTDSLIESFLEGGLLGRLGLKLLVKKASDEGIRSADAAREEEKA